ncbi:MAG: hypothetical protein NCW75_03810 [Phycisphaera sp.]|nr:MAG: hypothetical protein NCW75_03810 [Phycisphaera sp.]
MIAIAALESLRVLHASGGTHGNVKAGNILLPRLSLRSAGVLLTDPGSDVNVSADEDVRSVGAFLHFFATGQASCEDGVASFERWSHLGSSAEVWCRVVHGLVDGDVGPEEAITQIRGSTRGAAPRSRVVAAVAVPLVVVSVAGGILVFQNEPDPKPEAMTWDAQSQKQWEALCSASDRWLLRFVQEVSTDVLERDEHLDREVVSSIRGVRDGSLVVDPRAIAGVEGMPTYADLAQQWNALGGESPDEATVRRAAGVAVSIERALTEDRWPLLDRLADLEVLFKDRGWNGLAFIAAELRSGVNLDAPQGLAAVVEDAIARGQRLTRIEDEWQNLATGASLFEATGNPLLDQFYEALASAAREVDRAGDPLGGLEAMILTWSSTYQRLVAMVRDRWEGLDAQLLNSETRVPAGADGLSLEAFETLLVLAEDPIYQRIDLSADPHPAMAIRARIDALAVRASGVEAALPGDEEAEALLDQLVSAAGELELFAARSWNRRTQESVSADAVSLSRTVGEIEPALAALEFVAKTTMSEFADTLARESSISGSPQINAVWRRQRDMLITTHAGDADVRQLARSVREIRDTLTLVESSSGASAVDDLAQQLPEGVRGEVVSDAYRVATNQSIGTMLAELDWASSGGLDDPEAAARLAVSQRMNEARFGTVVLMFRELASARQDLSRGLLGHVQGGAGAAPLSTWDAWAARPEFTDMLVPEAMPEFGTIITRIRELRSLGARESLAAIQLDDPFEVVVDAWARMSEATPNWPAEITEFRREQELRGILAAASQVAGEPMRTRMATLGLERWLRAHSVVSTVAELEEVLGASSEFFDDGTVLPGEVAYNIAVRDFSLLLAGADDDAMARQAARAFVDRITALDMAQSLVQARETLNRAQEILTDTGVSADPTTLGPATVGWRGVASPDNARIVFTRSIDGIERRLEFAFVPVAGGDPVYLATEELSIGLFSAIASRSDAWEELATEWLELAGARQGDTRWTGARGWAWRGGRLLGNGSWMVQDPTMSGRAVLAGGLDAATNPSPTIAHPMQDVSVLAAARVAELSGCRLPRREEYRDAYRELRDATGVTWNLRDSALAAQNEHVSTLRAQGVRISNPDESAFDAQPATSGADDSTVWFLPVDDGDGEPFRHLVGNVAEFVEANGGGFGVVGGSSLSGDAADRSFEMWPLPMARARTGFSDVGVRLAFDAPGVISRQPIREALADLLEAGAYILPNVTGEP